MKKFLKIIFSTLLVISFVLSAAFVSLQSAGATDPDSAAQSACEGTGGTWDAETNDCTTPGETRTLTSTLTQVGNILIFIIGSVSVIMVIVGALRYTLAQGDQSAVSAAKNTILYAIIGIVLSAAAYGIVNFITTQFD